MAYKTFVTATLSTCVLLSAALAPAHERDTGRPRSRIKHVVIIFQENASFDHYFATYPHATNPSGEPAFHALPGTPEMLY